MTNIQPKITYHADLLDPIILMTNDLTEGRDKLIFQSAF